MLFPLCVTVVLQSILFPHKLQKQSPEGILWKSYSKNRWVNLGYIKISSTELKITAEAYNFIKEETLTQVFSCEFCEISKNTFFTEHLWATAYNYTCYNYPIKKLFAKPLFVCKQFWGFLNKANVKVLNFFRKTSTKRKIFTNSFLPGFFVYMIDLMAFNSFCFSGTSLAKRWDVSR